MRFPSRSKAVKEQTKWLQEFASTRLDSQEADQRRHIPPHVFLELGRQGLLALQVPITQSGLGLTALDSLRIMEQLGAIDLSLGACVAVQNFLAGIPVRKHVSASLRTPLVADMIAGKQLVAFALTEPGAGSDPRRIKTEARRLSNGQWRVTGTKIWSGMAAWAGAFVMFAYAKDEKERDLGMTGFLLEATKKGVKCGPETLMMGLRGMVRNRVDFEDVLCDDSCVLDGVGKGRAIAQETMSIMRLYMAALALGAAKRALQLALRYVPQRNISTGTMSANPVVLRMIRESTSRVVSIECLLTAAAMMTDNEESCLLELYLACKIIASELASQVIDYSLQMTGGRGYVEPNGLARIYRDIRSFRIIEGPTEALATHLGGAFILMPERFEGLSICRAQASLLAPVIERLQLAGRKKSSAKKTRTTRGASLTMRHQAGLLVAHALAAAAVAEFCKGGAKEQFFLANEWAQSQLQVQLKQYDEINWEVYDSAEVIRDARDTVDTIGRVDETTEGVDYTRDPIFSGQ